MVKEESTTLQKIENLQIAFSGISSFKKICAYRYQ